MQVACCKSSPPPPCFPAHKCSVCDPCCSCCCMQLQYSGMMTACELEAYGSPVLSVNAGASAQGAAAATDSTGATAPAADKSNASTKRVQKRGTAHDFIERPVKGQPSPVDTMQLQAGASVKAPDGFKTGPKPTPDSSHMTRQEWRQFKTRMGGANRMAAEPGSGPATPAAADGESTAAAGDRALAHQTTLQSARQPSNKVPPVSPDSVGFAAARPHAAPDEGKSPSSSLRAASTESPSAGKFSDNTSARQAHARADKHTPSGAGSPQRRAAQQGSAPLGSLRRATDDLPAWISQGKRIEEPLVASQRSIDMGAAIVAAQKAGALRGGGSEGGPPPRLPAEGASLGAVQCAGALLIVEMFVRVRGKVDALSKLCTMHNCRCEYACSMQ